MAGAIAGLASALSACKVCVFSHHHAHHKWMQRLPLGTQAASAGFPSRFSTVSFVLSPDRFPFAKFAHQYCGDAVRCGRLPEASWQVQGVMLNVGG